MEKRKNSIKFYITTFLFLIFALALTLNVNVIFNSPNKNGEVVADEVVTDGLLYSLSQTGYSIYDPISGVSTEYMVFGYHVTGFSESQASGNTGTLQIPSVYNGQPVVGISSQAFGWNDSFRFSKVIIPNTVEYIDSYAFHGTYTLNEIVFEDNSALKFIGYYAFAESGLSSIILPDNLLNIGNGAFRHNYSLQIIYIPNSVIYVGDSAFANITNALPIFIEGNENQSDYWNSYWRYLLGTPVYYNIKLYNGFAYNLSGQILSYFGTDSEVVIPSQIDDVTITTLGAGSFARKSNITKITIPNTITDLIFNDNSNIGVFEGNINLKEVVFEDGSTLTTISGRAFSGNIRLESINLPNSVTYIESDAFNWNLSLKSITLPSSLQNMNCPFNNALKLVQIRNLSALSTETLYDMGGILSWNKGFEIVNGPTAEFSNVFSYDELSGIETFEITDGDYQGVYLFNYLGDESILDLNDFEDIEKIYFGAFTSSKNTNVVILPDGMTELGYGYFYGSRVTVLLAPASVTTVTGSPYGYYDEYNNLDALQPSIFFANSLESVEHQSWYFDYINVQFSAAVQIEGNYLFSVDENDKATISKYLGSESNVVIPNYLGGGLYEVVSIGESAFVGNISIKTVYIPNKVQTIRDTAFFSSTLQTITFEANSQLNSIGYRAFSESMLNSITIPSGVMTISSYAFAYNNNLLTVTFETGSQLQIIGNSAFYGTGIATILIPNSVTIIEDYAFANNNQLTSVSFENGINLTEISYGAFSNTSYLKNIIIPASVATIRSSAFLDSLHSGKLVIPTTVTTIESYAFQSEMVLYTAYESKPVGWDSSFAGYQVTVHYGVMTSGDYLYKVIDANSVAIIGHTGTSESVIIPNELNGKTVTEIGGAAFAYTPVLTYVFIPNTVEHIGIRAFYNANDANRVQNSTRLAIEFEENSSLKIIDDSAFYNAYLSNIVIPNSVLEIRYQAFRDANLQGVSFESDSSLELITTNAFAYNYFSSISLPSGIDVVENYAFDNWSVITIYLEEDEVPYSWGLDWHFSSGYGFYHNVVAGVNVYGNFIYGDLDEFTVEIKGFTGNVDSSDTSNLITVTIPKYINNKTVVRIGNAAFKNKAVSYFYYVYIPNTITSIGQEAFRESSIRLIFEENSTLEIIENEAFYGGLFGHLVVPKSVKHIGDSAFLNNPYYITFESGSILESIGMTAFGYDDYADVSTFVIPATVHTIGAGAFYYVNSSTIYLPFPENETPAGWDEMWNVYQNGYNNVVWSAFEYNNFAYSILNEDEVSIMGYAGVITEGEVINIPKTINGRAVVEIGLSAFNNKAGRFIINLPNTVRTIEENAFYNSELIRINFEQNSTLQEIKPYAFYGTQLISIVLPDSLITIGEGAFLNSTMLTTVVLNSNLAYVGELAFDHIGTYWWEFGEFLASQGVCRLVDGEERGTVYVNQLTVPSNWAENWFGNVNNVVDYGYMVINGTHANVKLGLVGVSGDLVYYANSDLNESVILYYSGTNVSLVIPSTLGGLTVKTIDDGAFIGSLLQAIETPSTLEHIGANAFLYSFNLSEIIIHDNSNLAVIESCAFWGTNLTQINLPASLQRIGTQSFGDKLTSITFHKDSLITVIPYLAFEGSKITEIILPQSVEIIDTYAFIASDLLQKIVLLRPSSLGITEMHQYGLGFGLTHIVVPYYNLEAYKTNEAWSDYSELFISEIYVVADSLEITYGDEEPELTYRITDITGDEIVFGDLINFDISRAAGTAAGEYIIGVYAETQNSNVVLQLVNGTLTINPVIISVIWQNLTFVYNGTIQAPTPVVEGISENDYEIIVGETINAGTYIAEIQFSSYDPNIQYDNLTVSYEILPILLTISGQDSVPVTKIYDGTTGANVPQSRFILDVDASFNTYRTVFENEQAGLTVLFSAAYISKDVTYVNNNVILSNLLMSSGNYVLDRETLLFAGVINPKQVSVVWNNTVVEYNGEMQAPNPTVATGVTNDLLQLSASNQYENAGRYTVTAVVVGNVSNYSIQNTTVEFVIEKRDLYVNALNNITKEYDGTTSAYGHVAFAYTGLIDGDDPQLNYVATYNSKNVAQATSVTINLVSLQNSNYNLLTSVLYKDGSITAKEVEVVWNDLPLVYNKTSQLPGYSINSGIVGEDLVVTVSGAAVNAGEYVAVVSLVNLSDNFMLINAEREFEITPKTLEIVGVSTGMNNVSKEYDSTNTAVINSIHYEIYGLITGDAITFDYDAAYDNENVGVDKLITVINLHSLNNNYVFTTESFTVVGDITPRQLTVIWSNLSFTYNGQINRPGARVEGLINGDEIVISVTEGTRNAGTHIATASIETPNSNYTLTNLTTQFTIVPKPITVFAVSGVSKTYDGTNIATIISSNYAFTGVITNDVVALTGYVARYNSSNVASANMVTVNSIVINNSNYVLLNNSFEVAGSITKKDITVQVLGTVTKVYDGTINALLTPVNYGFTGLINGDIVHLTYNAEYGNKNVGTLKTVNVYVTGVDSSNYNLALGVFTISGSITRKLITIQQTGNSSKSINSPDPAFDYVAVGLISGDTLQGTLSREEGEAVGFYDILPGTLTSALNGNYEFEYELAYLEITPFQLWPIIVAVILGVVFIGSIVVSQILLRGGRRKLKTIDDEFN